MKQIYFTLATLFITALSFGQELLLNGDFELWDDLTTPTSWPVAASVDRESAAANVHGDDYSAKHTGGTSKISQTVTGIIPGNDYTVTLWYKVGSGDATSARIWSFWRNSGSTLSDNAAELRGPANGYFDNNGNAWTEYTVTVTAPATANEFFFEVRTYSGSIVYYDDFSLFAEANACSVSLGSETYACDTNTAGVDNDDVIINIPYTGSDATITSVTTTASGGVVGGDDPASVSNGTITISGLSEGSAWDLILNGGGCDGTTVSGTVPSAECDPTTLVINEFLADPATSVADGDANGDGIRDGSDDEFIEIKNVSGSPIDLENYTISDGFGLRHTFTSTVLGTNTILTVFGGGTPMGIAGTVQVASSGSLGLNNSGDTITLKNASDVTVAEYTYGSEGGDDQSLARDPDYTGPFVKHLDDHSNSANFSPGAENSGILLSVNLNEIENFTVYPNPVIDGRVTINTMNNGVKAVQIFDMLGKQVLSVNMEQNGVLMIESLTTGMYILKVEEEGKVSTNRLMIE